MEYVCLTESLVDPIPVTPSGMITWNAAVAILCSLTDERRHRFLENRLQAAHNHPDPGTRYWIEKVSKQFVPGLQERLALTVAAMQGLAVYARNRQEFMLTASTLLSGQAMLLCS